MREIKFRGYNKEKGWVYGNLLEDDRPQEGSTYQIVNKTTDSRFDVEEESVGQYTGFKDKNGAEIYEGDIVKEPNDINGIESDEYLVSFDEFLGIWQVYDLVDKVPIYGNGLYTAVAYNCKVVGNIYEEKLKGEKENENL